METVALEHLTSPEIAARIAVGWTTCLIPVGSNEQHGPHLPTMTDSAYGRALGERVARALGQAFVAPCIAAGCSDHHMEFPGTISLRRETLQAVVTDYCRTLAQHGLTDLVLLPTHGGNFPPLEAMLADLRRTVAPARVHYLIDLDTAFDRFYQVAAKDGIGTGAAGAHAGEVETSIMLALHSGLVQMDKAAPGFTGDYREAREDFKSKTWKQVTGNGVVGDPTLGDRARGERYIETDVAATVELLKEALKSRS